MGKLNEPSDDEKKLCKDLRIHILKELDLMYITDEILCQKLELLPSGLVVLLNKEFWDIKTCIRVAYALGYNISICLTL
jgi:hypothetical protein